MLLQSSVALLNLRCVVRVLHAAHPLKLLKIVAAATSNRLL